MLCKKAYLLVLTLSMVPLLLAACGSIRTASGTGVNSVNSVKTLITWPFVPSTGAHWAIVNGYAVNGIPQNDHGLLAGSTYALDFALCASVTAQQTCDLSNGWDTTHTDGQQVISPVAGHVFYIDDHTGKDGGGGDSICRALGIQLTTSDNSHMVLQLAHIERLKHYDAQAQPDLAVGDAITQGERIGFVSAVGGGGCLHQSDHIHMELYSYSDTDAHRVAQPFQAPWTIAGCTFDTSSTHQGELVPCSGQETPTPTLTTQATPTYNVTGTWQSSLTGQISPSTGTFHLTQSGSQITGSYIPDTVGEGGPIPLSGSITGSQVTLRAIYQVGYEQWDFQGALNDMSTVLTGKATLTYTFPNHPPTVVGPDAWSATKQ